ncbi:MAG: glycosyltransferase [Deltaproteobacteria bacterium]|nr:glycosyltransferase [Deltaproteobacteria bacterium]
MNSFFNLIFSTFILSFRHHSNPMQAYDIEIIESLFIMGSENTDGKNEQLVQNNFRGSAVSVEDAKGLKRIEFKLNKCSTKEDLLATLRDFYQELCPGGQLVIVGGALDRNRKLYDEPAQTYSYTKFEWENSSITPTTLKRLLNITGFLILDDEPSIPALIATKESCLLRHRLPKVSLAIPAFKADYFQECLESALIQNYMNLDILVADEGVDDRIEQIVRKCSQVRNGPPIFYFKHRQQLGEIENIRFCQKLSFGKYFKILNDDDLLYPNCILTMVRFFEAFDDSVTVVTSKRNVIDQEGKRLFEGVPFRPIVENTSYIFGKDAIELCLSHLCNFIGEPTSYMLKTGNLDDYISVINDEKFECSFDILIFIKQLLKGNLIYISEPLSALRIHNQQSSRQPEVASHCHLMWADIIQLARHKLGLLQDNSLYQNAVVNSMLTIDQHLMNCPTHQLDKLRLKVLELFEELNLLPHNTHVKFKNLSDYFRLIS